MQRFLSVVGRPVRVRAGARTAAAMVKQFALGLAAEGGQILTTDFTDNTDEEWGSRNN